MLGGRHGERLAQHHAHGSAKKRAAAQSHTEHDIGQLAARRFAGVVVRSNPPPASRFAFFSGFEGGVAAGACRAPRTAFGPDVGLLDRELVVVELAE